jgi:hypothetical protein
MALKAAKRAVYLGVGNKRNLKTKRIFHLMKALLNLIFQALSYGDTTASSNPSRHYINWKRSILKMDVENSDTNPLEIDPGASKVVFDGTRSTSIDGTTAWSLSLITGQTDKYRFTNVSGTAPALRTDRGITLNGRTITWTVLVNGSVTVQSSTAGDFAAVVVGDAVFVPGTSTGDTATVFNAANEGDWTVLSKDGTNTILQLIRPTGSTFSGATEATVCSANAQFQAFSSSGVQVGDTVTISAGFVSSAQKTYKVDAVTPTRFDVTSTLALPNISSSVPGATGIVFYTSGKRYLRVELDQEALVRVNGDSGSTNRISPWIAGDEEKMGWYEKVGPVWSLEIVNKSQSVLSGIVLSAE